MEIGGRLGPYEVTARIGAGGMGEVWKAIDTRLERSVAIKILPAEFANDAQLRLRFEREARTISQLEHPHICRLYDVGEVQDPRTSSSQSYLVLELLDGESLADRLARGPLPMSDVLRYGAQIADALDRAHRAGIVHRDLKPGNIVLTRSGAKLLDFGLARSISAVSLDGATVQKPLTQEGMIVGTFQYMAPEQIEGADADARTDIFALGAVLYEMATGRRAFEGKTKASLIAAIVDRDPTPMSEIQPLTPRQFERVVSTCLSKNPDERWQSAGDLRRELEWIRDASTSRETSITPPQRTRRRMLTILALTLLPIAAAVAAFFVARATAPPPRRMVSSIAAPTNTRFVVTGDAGGPVTLSPDGRMAAFVANDGKDVDLWIQSLDTGVNTRLAGTSNAMFPFWSPDSKSVGFFSTGRLLVVDVDGSAPRVVAEAPDARGGTWTPDGQIIFTPMTQAGLFHVPASGGVAKTLTTPVPPHTTHRWPAVLRDGKHIVFFAASHGEPTSPENAVMIATVDGKNIRKVVATNANALPFRDFLIYPRGERLLLQRFEDGVLTGTPVGIWDRALNDPGTWRTIASVSDAGLLATYPSAPLNGMRLVSIDTGTKEVVDLAPRGIYRDLALSPDGEKLAVTIGDPNSVLYVEDLRRGVRTRFSFVDQVGFPAWSTDGKILAFNTSSRGGGNFEVVMKPVDGGAPERTLATAAFPLQPTSVDPAGVVLYNTLDTASPDVMGVSLNGGKPHTVVGGPGQQTNGFVSPDGRWLTYVEVSSAGRNAFVTTYPKPGPKWQVADDTAYWLWWAGNGKQLYYLTGTGDIKTVDLTFEANSVQFSAPRQIIRVNLNTNRRGLTMSADGRRIIAASVTDDDPGAAVLVTNFDGVR